MRCNRKSVDDTLNYLTKLIQITECRYVRVKYKSLVDWTIKTNYLRCNPKFHGEPRYDFVIINPPKGGLAFAQLVLIFIINIRGQDYHLALVQLLEQPSRPADVKKSTRPSQSVGGTPEIRRGVKWFPWILSYVVH